MDLANRARRLLARGGGHSPHAHHEGSLLAAGLAVGAAAAYFLDRRSGRRRRALVRDKGSWAIHRLVRLSDKAVRDLRHRAEGFLASAGHRSTPVRDEVLAERVRAKLGRLVSHPHAISVAAEDGRILLRGPLLASEARRVRSSVAAMPGVAAIDNQLEICTTSEHVSALQGGSPRMGHQFELFQENWAPATRLALGTLGVGLGAWGIARRDAAGLLLAATGTGLLLRTVENRPLVQVLGLSGEAGAVHIQKTIMIRATIDEVLALLTDFSHLPRVMDHVRKVDKRRNGHWHWTVAGPAGLPIGWDAEMGPIDVEARTLTWRSTPGAMIASSGTVRVDPASDGFTRLDIKFSYSPPGGVLAHALASLFGADPKHALDEDLLRLKSLLERGKTTAHGHEVRFGDLTREPAKA